MARAVQTKRTDAGTYVISESEPLRNKPEYISLILEKGTDGYYVQVDREAERYTNAPYFSGVYFSGMNIVEVATKLLNKLNHVPKMPYLAIKCKDVSRHEVNLLEEIVRLCHRVKR